MENALPYHHARISQKIVPVMAGPTTSLNTKTEDYLRNLRRFELRSIQPGADQTKLLQELAVLNESMLYACASFERLVKDPKLIQDARTAFRRKTTPFFSQSYLFNRTRTWPQGHQGDFMTLEFCYRNATLSEGVGYYLDKYFLSDPLVAAFRERLEALRGLLKKELDQRKKPRVLDIGCASCREVFQLYPEIKASAATFMCIDLDSEALNFACERFSHAGFLSDQVEFLSYNALRMFSYEAAEREFGKQDIIYSAGFFDYLSDDFFVKLVKSLYKLLNPGGKLIVAFQDGKQGRSLAMQWFAHWDGFMHRTKKDIDRLLSAADIPQQALTISKVPSGRILFYTAAKK